MEDDQSQWLLAILVGALALGLVVLWVRDDYRFDEIIESNRNYFPSVDVEAP